MLDEIKQNDLKIISIIQSCENYSQDIVDRMALDEGEETMSFTVRLLDYASDVVLQEKVEHIEMYPLAMA